MPSKGKKSGSIRGYLLARARHARIESAGPKPETGPEGKKSLRQLSAETGMLFIKKVK
jgi:hypothetical protein